MKIEPTSSIASCRQGSLDVSYETIVSVLGEPNASDDPDKVTYSWAYLVDGHEVAIWDYKGSRWSYYAPHHIMDQLFGCENVRIER